MATHRPQVTPSHETLMHKPDAPVSTLLSAYQAAIYPKDAMFELGVKQRNRLVRSDSFQGEGIDPSSRSD